MDTQGTRGATNERSRLGYQPRSSVDPAVRASKRKSLRSEARRRRIMANVFFVGSSVLALAVVGICYALLRQ